MFNLITKTMRRRLTKLAISAIGLALSVSAYCQYPVGQTVVVVDTGAGNLETAINNDVNNDGTRINPNRVYQLKGGMKYEQLAPIVFGVAGTADTLATLTIIGDTAGGLTIPFIYQNPLNGGGAKVNAFYGRNLILKNVYFQVQAQNSTCAELWRLFSSNPRVWLDNFVAEGENSNDLINFQGYGKLDCYANNCYIRDNTQFNNPWNFAFISPGNNLIIDTLWVTNTTVANAGLTFFAKITPVNFVFFDHNTIINIPKYTFFFDEYKEGYFTNNAFVNTNWQGECEQMEASQLEFQLKWGPIPAGTINLAKQFIDTAKWMPNYGAIPSLSEVKLMGSNNLQFTSPYLSKYYSGGYNDSIGGNGKPVPYAISYINWGVQPVPPLPSQVFNAPPVYINQMTDSLANKYKGAIFFNDLYTSDPGFVTEPIGSQAKGDVYAQWARSNYGVHPGGINNPLVPQVDQDSIVKFFMFGDGNPKTFPGHKSETSGTGINSVLDFNENFGYTSNLKSKIDGKQIGSLQWYPGTLSSYNAQMAFAQVKLYYSDTVKGAYGYGIEEATSEIPGRVYPNPTTGILTIEIPNSESFAYDLYDLTGRIVLSKANIAGSSTKEDISGLAKGIYFIKVGSANQSFTTKVILK